MIAKEVDGNEQRTAPTSLPDCALPPSDPSAEAAAEALIARVQPNVRAYLAVQGVRGDNLDDLCQQSRVHLLLALRARRAAGRAIENGAAFARKIARNLLLDAGRRARARPPTTSLDALAEESGSHAAVPAAPDDVADRVLSVLAAEQLRAWLWQEVRALPPFQRAALLLGMEPDELLSLQYKQSEIAQALGLPLDDFLGLWRGLPLSDRQIAHRLGVANVSNLRKCARERLARRLASLQP